MFKKRERCVDQSRELKISNRVNDVPETGGACEANPDNMT
jgi:hypothetical protein